MACKYIEGIVKRYKNNGRFVRKILEEAEMNLAERVRYRSVLRSCGDLNGSSTKP